MTAARRGRPPKQREASGEPSWEEGGPSPEQQAVPRNCAGKVEHKYIAERMLEAGIAAFGGDQLQYGKLQQALTYAGRLARANWRQYVAEQNKEAA